MKCRACQRELSDAEPVYRVRGGSVFGGYPRVDSVCAQCAEEHWPMKRQWQGKWYVSHNWLAAKPCCHCQRPLIVDEWCHRKGLRYFVCGTECRQAIEAGNRAAQRRRRRGLSRECTVCGQSFPPKRIDSIYCSSACKQRSYRLRSSP